MPKPTPLQVNMAAMVAKNLRLADLIDQTYKDPKHKGGFPMRVRNIQFMRDKVPDMVPTAHKEGLRKMYAAMMVTMMNPQTLMMTPPSKFREQLVKINTVLSRIGGMEPKAVEKVVEKAEKKVAEKKEKKKAIRTVLFVAATIASTLFGIFVLSKD